MQAVTKDILDAFAACPDIQFAHATLRMYSTPVAGNSASSPEAREEVRA